jgi:similar to stage IV sporulation protein
MRSELWLTEGVRMQALCRDPAELMTAFCLAGIDASDFRCMGENRYRFDIPAYAADRAQAIGSRTGAEISVLRRAGFLHFLRRFRKRAYLLLIPLPFLLCFLWLSTCLWEIEVSGNLTVSHGDILSALEAVGVYPGVSGLHLDNAQIRSRMQEALEKLSWCTVQVHGSRALVVVRERRLPPEIVDDHLPREVAAGKTGTIESMNILEGRALVKKGDTVLRGQTLITGVLTDRQGQTRRVHAMGRVFARTWYILSAEMPLEIWEKTYTGEERALCSLEIGDLRLNFYNDCSISGDCYDRIQESKRLSAFGLALPLRFIRTRCRAYALSSRELGEEEGAQLLEDRLLYRLSLEAPEAEVLETGFQRERRGGVLRVTMLAQCRENIGEERDISGT